MLAKGCVNKPEEVPMSSIKTTRRTLLGGAAAALAMPAIARAQAPFTIGTGTTGGVYYPLGGGMATVLSRDVPGMTAKIEVTGGSVGNLELLSAGKAGLGFSQVDAAVNAYEGDGRFRGHPIPIRTLAVLYTNHMQIVTTAASGIRKMADLKGKRISTGDAGSATEGMAIRLMVAAGLDRDRDFAARERLGSGESTTAIKEGKLDAYFFVSGIPTSAITDLGSTPGTQLVMVDHADLADRVVARHGPVYFPDVIPAGTYPGQKADNKQVSVANILAVMETMPDEQVKTILGALWGAKAELVKAHSEAQHFTLEGQKTSAAGVPWHPAAEDFWRMRGASLA